jgi:hypothetical protein
MYSRHAYGLRRASTRQTIPSPLPLYTDDVRSRLLQNPVRFKQKPIRLPPQRQRIDAGLHPDHELPTAAAMLKEA